MSLQVSRIGSQTTTKSHLKTKRLQNFKCISKTGATFEWRSPYLFLLPTKALELCKGEIDVRNDAAHAYVEQVDEP